MRLMPSLGWRPSNDGPALRTVVVLVLVAAFAQSVMPRFDVGPLDAIPNVLVVAVVAVGALRGVIVGACAGFAAGLIIELITPSATLGVMALAYVAIGAWSGRFAENAHPIGLWTGLFVSTVAAAIVPLWVGAVELLRGSGPPIAFLVGDLALPHLVFAPLVGLPAWWIARRLLGAPRVVEPWLVTA